MKNRTDSFWGRFARKPRNIKALDSLKVRGYRFYYLSMAGQWGAMQMQTTTQSLLVYRITGSPALLGLVSLANALPTVLLSLFGGAIADWVPKKNLIQIGQITSLLLTAGIIIPLATGYMSSDNPGSWWIILLISILQGAIGSIALPARQAIIPELVNKNQIMNAVALNTMGQNIFRLVSPAVAGILIDASGFISAYCTMLALYVLAIIFTIFIPRTLAGSSSRGNAFTAVSEGLKYVWKDSTIFFVMLMVILSAALVMPIQTIIPVFTDDILKVGATGLGILMGVTGAGAVLGSIVLASLANKKRGLILYIASFVQGIVFTIFAFSRSWPLALGLMVILGIGQSWHQTVAVALLQTAAEARYLGRIMGILVMNMGITSLGAFIAGLLAEKVGPPWSVGSFALMYIVVTMVIFIFVPRIKKLD